MKAPAHLSAELRAIWDEIVPTLYEDTPPAIVETIAVQIATLRSARKRIEVDGLIVVDGKNNAVEHPALAVERAATKQISDLLRAWGAE